MTPTEIAAVVGPVAVLTAAVTGALIARTATVRSARQAAVVAWRLPHVKDQDKAVTALLSDTRGSDTTGATLNLEHMAPTEEIWEVALRIQELDRELAKPPVRVLGLGERALEQLRRHADEEQFREEAGESCGREARDLLDEVLELRREQERALDAGEPDPDVTRLREELEAEGMGYISAAELLAPAIKRRMAGADRTRMERESSAVRRAAEAEREDLCQRLTRLRTAWRETPPS
ncbi:hypothetical protein ACFVJM_29055 [Streptomyces virginiae]|uniref:hypothetical protein n=1 Tax=Streptomyces virginiae TaxID=1961 RepID=UPI003626B72E